MRIDDDTVLAYHATRDLMRLYDAYRATARAQIAAIQQIRRYLTASNLRRDRPAASKLAEIGRHEALVRHRDAIFAERREQLRARLYELQDLPELS